MEKLSWVVHSLSDWLSIQNISVMMFSLSMADLKVVFGWLVAHEILVTAQRPNSPSLFMDLTGGVLAFGLGLGLGFVKKVWAMHYYQCQHPGVWGIRRNSF